MNINKIFQINWLQCTGKVQNVSSEYSVPNLLSRIATHMLCIRNFIISLL
jgi:hypothetical protein